MGSSRVANGAYGEAASARWTLFGYYAVMGPQGEVSREDWPQLLSRLPSVCPTYVPRVPESPRRTTASGRPRSTSPEHVARCQMRWGSQKLARQSCLRCCWIKGRARLAMVLSYEDTDG